MTHLGRVSSGLDWLLFFVRRFLHHFGDCEERGLLFVEVIVAGECDAAVTQGHARRVDSRLGANLGSELFPQGMQGVPRREPFAMQPVDRFFEQTIAAVMVVAGGPWPGLDWRFDYEGRAVARLGQIGFQDFQKAGVNVNVRFGVSRFGAGMLGHFNPDCVPVPLDLFPLQFVDFVASQPHAQR